MRRQLALAIVSAHPAPGALRPFLLGIMGIVLVALFLAPRPAEACAMRYRPEVPEELVAEKPGPQEPGPSLEEIFAQIDAPTESPAPEPLADEAPAPQQPVQPQS